MKYKNLILIFLLAAFVLGCQTVPDPTSVYDEEIVVRVWDLLDAYYGNQSFFECEYLAVRNGKIEVARPYPVSDTVVVGYSRSTNETWLFRPVSSNPGENEVVVDGTTLRFNPCHESQTVFVAWIPQVDKPGTGTTSENDRSER
jgi:hypothetical protein